MKVATISSLFAVVAVILETIDAVSDPNQYIFHQNSEVTDIMIKHVNTILI